MIDSVNYGERMLLFRPFGNYYNCAARIQCGPEVVFVPGVLLFSRSVRNPKGALMQFIKFSRTLIGRGLMTMMYSTASPLFYTPCNIGSLMTTTVQ